MEQSDRRYELVSMTSNVLSATKHARRRSSLSGSRWRNFGRM